MLLSQSQVNNLQKSKVKSMSFNTNKFRAFNEKLNGYLAKEGRYDEIVELDSELVQKSANSYTVKKKALTGANPASGNAMVGQNYAPISLDLFAIEKGDVFRTSGSQFRANVSGNYTFPAFQNIGKFASTTPGTPLTNDIGTGTGVNNPVLFDRYAAEFGLFESPLLSDYLHDRGQAFAVFEQVIEMRKGTLADDLVVNNIATNPAGITALATSGETDFPVTQEANKLINQFRKFGVPKVYVNHQGLSILQNESLQSSNGANTVTTQFFRTSNLNGAIPEMGLAGYLNGAEVHIVPAIPSTVTVDGSNVITSLSGGTDTFLFVAIPQKAIGQIRGKAETDTIAIFDSTNSLEAYRSDETIIGAKTNMGASLINPYMAGYYCFTA